MCEYEYVILSVFTSIRMLRLTSGVPIQTYYFPSWFTGSHRTLNEISQVLRNQKHKSLR